MSQCLRTKTEPGTLDALQKNFGSTCEILTRFYEDHRKLTPAPFVSAAVPFVMQSLYDLCDDSLTFYDKRSFKYTNFCFAHFNIRLNATFF